MAALKRWSKGGSKEMLQRGGTEEMLRRGRTKEMMPPCLIHLHLDHLFAKEAQPKR